MLKHPKAKILEDAPLDALRAAKLTRHDRLLAKVRDYKEHQKRVAFAVETIEGDELHG